MKGASSSYQEASFPVRKDKSRENFTNLDEEDIKQEEDEKEAPVELSLEERPEGLSEESFKAVRLLVHGRKMLSGVKADMTREIRMLLAGEPRCQTTLHD